MEFNHLAGDIVPEAPASQGKTVLAFASGYAFQLLDVVAARSIIRFGRKNISRALLNAFEISMPFEELVGEPLVPWRAADSKGRRRGHALGRCLARPFF